MVRRTRVAFAIAGMVLASACGSQGGTLVGPEERPAYDAGGGPLVGGNVTGQPDPEPEPGASTASAEPAREDSTSRGGGPLVGGN